jgi:hypothetical protein
MKPAKPLFSRSRVKNLAGTALSSARTNRSENHAATTYTTFMAVTQRTTLIMPSTGMWPRPGLSSVRVRLKRLSP